MKIIIAGSRTIHWWYGHDLYELLYRHFPDFTEVVSGLAQGPDTHGKTMALERDIPVKEFPADWNTFGKKAGALRNIQMAEYADGLLALWDGKSRGTKHMIESMLERNKPIHVELCLE